MGAGRKLGKLMLAVSRGADRMSDGFDMVLGEDRTDPGDTFSKDRAGRKAGKFTRQARKSNKGKTSGFLDKNKDKDFFGKKKNGKDKKKDSFGLSSKSEKEDDDRDFF